MRGLIRLVGVALALVCASPARAQVSTLAPPVIAGAKPVTVVRIKVHSPSVEGNLEGNAAARDVLLVPTGAVSMKRGDDGGKPQAQVTVVTASGASEVRTVETGIRNRVSVEVKSGLEEGDQVVVTAGSALASSGPCR